MVNGMCSTCGFVMKGNTRAMVDGQFSLHCDEKHKIRMSHGKMMVLKFFEGEAPAIDKVVVKKSVRKPSNAPKVMEGMAVWV